MLNLIPRRWAHTLPGEFNALKAALREPGQQNEGAVEAWESKAADYLGVPGAAAISSGRQGMRLIFEHLGVGEGDEVIVPAYTLAALIPLIESLGARAVPADIDIDTLNVTAASVEARFSAKTSAVLVLHAFGMPAPVEEIVALADARKIPVVEDCAHSMGATIDGRQTGTFGAAGFYSFEPTKPVNTYGGGLVVSRDEALLAKVRETNRQGRQDMTSLAGKIDATQSEQKLLATGLAFPALAALAVPGGKQLVAALYRLRQSVPSGDLQYAPLQAAWGMKKLDGLDARRAARDAAAATLTDQLSELIRPQQLRPGCTSSWYFYVAVLPRRAAGVRTRLLWRGIDAAVGDEIADDVAALQGVDDCPNAAHVFDHAIALPMFDGVSDDQIARIASAVNRVIQA